MAKTTTKSKKAKTKTARVSSTKKTTKKTVSKAKKQSPKTKTTTSGPSQLARLTGRIKVPARLQIGRRLLPRDADGLRTQNFILGILFGLQGIILLVVGKSVHIPVTLRYITNDSLASKAAGEQVLADASRHVVDVNVLYLLAAVLFVAAAFSLLQATIWRPVYEKDIASQKNRFRWGELAITATLLLGILALLAGVRDLATLIGLCGLSVVLHVVLHAMEQRKNQTKKPDWLTYIVACFAGGVTWVIIGLYLLGISLYGDGQLPGYVYWLSGTMFALCSAVALNSMLLQRATGKWADYLYGENAYMILGFVIKTAFVWVLFAGALS